MPLTDAGRDAAGKAGKTLRSKEFAAVFTSPMSRAKETCSLAGLGDAAEVLDDLSEWDYGDVEGITTDQMRESIPGWTVWRDGCPGGETIEQVAVRADRVIERARAVDGDVIAFAHGHILRVLGARWTGQPALFAEHLLLSTAAICVLGWERDAAALSRWNDTSHLDD